MIAMPTPIRLLTFFRPPEPTPADRAVLDREAAVLGLAISIVLPAGLSGAREQELVRLGSASLRAAVERLDAAVEAARLLDTEEAAADAHVQGGCGWCTWRSFAVGHGCPGLRRIRRAIGRAEHLYRRAVRRIGGS